MRFSVSLLSFFFLFAAPLPAQTRTIRSATVEVSFSRSGAYSILDLRTHWALHGALNGKISSLRMANGTDGLGVLSFGSGINRTFAAWGMALEKLNGKPPVSNDADVVLNKFGCWTDNGAS